MKEYISEQTFWSLIITDCNLPRAYGLPKIHKPDSPLRIIITSLDSLTYNMTSVLQNSLKKVHNSLSYMRDSSHLVNELKDIVLPEDQILVSFDVKLLFTNIPRDLAVDSIKKGFPNLGNVTKLTLNKIIASTLFVMNSTSFGFNGQFS